MSENGIPYGPIFRKDYMTYILKSRNIYIHRLVILSLSYHIKHVSSVVLRGL